MNEIKNKSKGISEKLKIIIGISEKLKIIIYLKIVNLRKKDVDIILNIYKSKINYREVNY